MGSDATVRQHYKQSSIYEQFVDEHGVFTSYIDLFVFAACVGHANNKFETIDYTGDDDTKGEMLWMHFSNKDLYRAIAAAIAYQHYDDPAALIDPEIQLETLAMYAAGGAKVLQSEFGNIKGDPTDAILNYIQDWDEKEDTETRQTVLGKIVSSFDDDLFNSE